MLLGVRLVNSLGLTGVAFAGYDAGGFVGDANTKLFARWISIAALSPFFRGHTMINTRDAEPWSYGEEVEQIARNFIKLRYQWMPYIYSLFHEAATTGKPVQRSLALDYPHYDKVYDGAYHNQYLLGPSVLVAPVESTRDLMKVWLPPGDWYYLYTAERYTGDREIFRDCPIHRLPVFVKAGAVLPGKRAGRNTQDANEEMILHVYAGNTEEELIWYEDDGETFAYQQGAFARRRVTHNPKARSLTLSAPEGAYRAAHQTLRLVLHAFPALQQVHVGQALVAVETSDFSYFTPLEKYDPINDPEWMGSETVQSFTIPFPAGELAIHW
jgi:alpha-glucosidase